MTFMERLDGFFATHDKSYRAALICLLPIAIPLALCYGMVDLWDDFWSEWNLSKYNASRRLFDAETRARLEPK